MNASSTVVPVKRIKPTLAMGFLFGIFFVILFMASFWGLATTFEDVSKAYSSMLCSYII